jgi:hypothetical protein
MFSWDSLMSYGTCITTAGESGVISSINYPEDGADTFIRNVDNSLQDCIVSQSRKP